MHIKTTRRVLHFFLCLVISVLPIPVFGESSDSQEIKTLMETVMFLDDLDDSDAIEKQRKLISFGELAYPVFAELMDKTSDPVAISRILEVFIESKGDKTAAVNAVKKLLNRENTGPNNTRINLLAVDSLAQIGTTNDVCAILPYICDPSEMMRISAMRALAILGTTNELVHIEKFLKEQKTKVPYRELQNDKSLHEGRKAIESIYKRNVENNPQLSP